MRLTVAAPAKINLFLDITGKRSDGYHLINTVMQSVSLYDDVTVTVDKDGEGISVSCTDEEIPCDKTNTAYMAAKAFFEYTELPEVAVNVRIKKRIPSGAGMAGGSTDGAAVIYALDQLLETGLKPEQLAEIGEMVGSDVPFCIYGGTMSATGTGTILSPLPDMPECFFAAVKPDFKVSTGTAYAKSDELGYEDLRDMQPVVNAICNGSVRDIGKSMYNKFEAVIASDQVAQIRQIMLEHHAAGAMMTGSGSVVYGIFESRDDAEECRRILAEQYEHTYLMEPCSGLQTDTGFFNHLFG